MLANHASLNGKWAPSKTSNINLQRQIEHRTRHIVIQRMQVYDQECYM